MKNKKGLVLTDTLIYILIAVFVFLVLIFIIPKLLGGSAKETKNLLSSTRDYDNDGIADFFDKCVCMYGEGDGCPTQKETPDYSKLKYQKCPVPGKAPTYEEKKTTPAKK